MKVLLLDAGGVILKKQREYFGTVFAREYNVPESDIVTFLKTVFVECQVGNGDLKEAVQPYLSTLGWKGNIDEFLTYWFSYDDVADEEVLQLVREAQAKGVRCYLATNQEKYRAEHLKGVLEKKVALDGYFFSYKLRATKSSPLFFTKVLETLQVPPAAVVFVDDEEDNVEVASTMGIHAVLYTPERLRELITA